MKFVTLFVVLILPLLVFTQSLWAQSLCPVVFAELKRYEQMAFDPKDPNFKEDDIETWQPLIKPLEMDGRGRGFISSFPVSSAEAKKAAEKRGYKDWGIYTMVVESIAEAREIHDHIQNYSKNDPLLIPLFIVRNDQSFAQRDDLVLLKLTKEEKSTLGPDALAARQREIDAENNKRELSLYDVWQSGRVNPQGNAGLTGIGYFAKDGSVKYLTQADAQRFFFFESPFMKMDMKGRSMHFFYQKGWFLPPFRGVVDLREFFYDKEHTKVELPVVDKAQNIDLPSTTGFTAKLVKSLRKQFVELESENEKQAFVETAFIVTYGLFSIFDSRGAKLAGEKYSGLPDKAKQRVTEEKFVLRNRQDYAQKGMKLVEKLYRSLPEDVKVEYSQADFIADLLLVVDLKSQTDPVAFLEGTFKANKKLATEVREQASSDRNERVAQLLGSVELSPSQRDLVSYLLEKVFPIEVNNGRIDRAKDRRADLERTVRNLVKQGFVDENGVETTDFTIKFNTNIRGAILGAANQNRVGQGEAAGKARFNEEFIQTYERLLAEGKAYSVEMYNQNGVLIASIFGDIGEGTFNGRSVHHPTIRRPKEGGGEKVFGIEFAKFLFSVSFERFYQAGFKMADEGMRSNMTADLGGIYIPVEIFQSHLAREKRENPVSFDNVNWDSIHSSAFEVER